MIFFQTGCQKAAHLDFVDWRGEGEIPQDPKGLDHTQGLQKFTLPAEEETEAVQLQMQNQKIHGVLIENSFYKQVVVKGQPQLISYQWLDKFPSYLRPDVVMMKSHQKRVFDKIKKKYITLRGHRIEGEPELVLRIKNNRPQIHWKIKLQVHEGHLVAFYFDKNLNLLEQVSLGSQFVDAKAQLYPLGPLKSQLQEVTLKNLIGNSTLTSQKIRVSTQAQEVAKSETHHFIYPVSDGRFEQVQVFYYLAKSMLWFQEHYHFALPFQIEAQTAVGYPEKTNTAFYYQGKIRLGDGDGQTYSQIPLDPSIVIHESIHAIIDQIAQLPYEGSGGSLNEAFADYFSATQLSNPLMAEASYKTATFKRSLDNEMTRQDLNGGLYHDSQIISGLFWALRKELGEKLADNLAWQTLTYLTPKSDFDHFEKELNRHIEKLSDEQKKKAYEVLKKRGWL